MLGAPSRGILRRKKGLALKEFPPSKTDNERTREFAALVAAVRRLVTDQAGEDGEAAAARGMVDMVARFDRDLRYLEVGPAAFAADGFPSSACIGKTHRELGLPEVLCEPWNAALRRVFESARPEKLILALPDGATRYLDCRMVPELDAEGKVRSVLSVARDITELKQAYDSEHRARYLHDAFREASLMLAGSLNRDVVFATLLECLRQVVPFDRGTVMLIEEGSQASMRALFDGVSVRSLPADERTSIDLTGHRVLQDLIFEGAPVLLGDVRCDPEWNLDPDSDNCSFMAVGLRARGEVVGFFTLAKKETDFFDHDRLRVAELMAAQAAVAVENSILFEQMESSTKRMRSLSRRLVQVQENERRHIARELHDDAGQALVSLRYGLRLLEKEIGPDGAAAKHVAELRLRTDAVMDSLHRLAVDLRPASLDHLGLDAALRQYALAAGSKYGLAVRFKSRGFFTERLPSAVETALYRVVQEAMTNVVRHARATRVDLLVERRGERVIVMMEDDGVGFDQHRLQRTDHLGLIGLRERAEALDGTLTVESSPGSGTTIVVEVASADPNPDR